MDPRGVPEIPGYENIHMQELQPHTKAHTSYAFFLVGRLYIYTKSISLLKR